jgi:hypothetical protein
MIFYSVGNPVTRLRFLLLPFNQNDDYREDGISADSALSSWRRSGKEKGPGIIPGPRASDGTACRFYFFTFT